MTFMGFVWSVNSSYIFHYFIKHLLRIIYLCDLVSIYGFNILNELDVSRNLDIDWLIGLRNPWFSLFVFLCLRMI